MNLLALGMVASGLATAGPFYGPEVNVGVEGSQQSGFAIANLTSPSVDGRVTLVARISLTCLYYEYLAEQGNMRVLSPGLGVGVGVRWRPARFSFTALAGYEARDTLEFAPDGDMRPRVDHGISLTADAYFQANSRLAVALVGYYGFAQEYLWTRALVKHQILPLQGSSIVRFSMGLDATVYGNGLVRGVDGGVLGELALPGNEAAFTLRVGLGREIQPGSSSALGVSAGTSFYKSF